MKKNILLLCFISFIALDLVSQNIGKLSINFRDASRTGGFSINGAASFPAGGSGRNIGTEIYYPATTNGNNTPIISGDYPIIVFGHGFAMTWDAYQNIWENLVPRGYIVAFPRTEGGLLPAPSHGDFGADLALVEVLLQQMGTTSGNILFGNVSPNGAIIGHSMGGGATFIAGANNTSPTLKTVVGLAPAETNPSAIAAAANVTVDVLVLSGSTDGVTAPNTNHLPIYNAANSACKYFFSLIGGGHCRFANSNFNCEFGESTSGGAGALSRAQVHSITNSILNPWFDFKLKGSCTAWTTFQGVITASANIAVTQNCNYDVIPNVSITPIGTASNCQGGSITLEYSPLNPNYTYQWANQSGIINGQTTSPFITSTAGQYYVEATSSFNCSAISNTTNVTFTPPTTPTFSFSTSLCSGATPPSLPSNSSNGISGAWNPATFNNTASDTYTFTAFSGQCANNFQFTSNITTPATPIFNIPNILCLQATVPTLTLTSNNGITGTWNPSSIDNAQNGTYVFTPNVGQCALAYTHSITISTVDIEPTFAIQQTVCAGETAPSLPSSSLENISGSWNPSTIDNTQGGTYTFTPNAGQCGLVTSIDVEVFTAQNDTISIQLCQGDSFQLANGFFVSDEGTYNDTIVSSLGCDSLYRTINLTNNNDFYDGEIEFVDFIYNNTWNILFHLNGTEPYDSIYWEANYPIVSGQNSDTLALEVPDPSTSIITVLVFKGNCFSEISDSIYFVWGSVSNLTKTNRLSVYPNPTNSIITINFNTNEKVDVTIINILGKIVYKGTISEQNNKIDVGTFAKGVYTVLTSEGSAKFVISD